MTNLPTLFDLSGRVAVVTGGAGLLGAQFCRVLAEAGASVVIADLDRESAFDLASSLTQDGYQATGHMLDVTSIHSVQAMVSAALDIYQGLHILVNSAALDPKFDNETQNIHSYSFENYPLELWQQALDINLTGAMLCCQYALPLMLDQGSGTIINIASIYGLVAPDQRLYQQKNKLPHFKPAYYAVTKAGILGLTKYLAAYCAGKDIRVNALTPGGIYNGHDDAFVKAYAARTVLGRMGEEDEMNGALLFLASDASKYMTGANLIVDGGWTTW